MPHCDKVCALCGTNFSSSGGSENLVKTHVNTRACQFVASNFSQTKCTECKKQYDVCTLLIKHIVEHHSLLPFHCLLCESKFTLKEAANHTLTHLEVAAASVTCYHSNVDNTKCLQKFENFITFLEHLAIVKQKINWTALDRSVVADALGPNPSLRDYCVSYFKILKGQADSNRKGLSNK